MSHKVGPCYWAFRSSSSTVKGIEDLLSWQQSRHGHMYRPDTAFPEPRNIRQYFNLPQIEAGPAKHLATSIKSNQTAHYIFAAQSSPRHVSVKEITYIRMPPLPSKAAASSMKTAELSNGILSKASSSSGRFLQLEG